MLRELCVEDWLAHLQQDYTLYLSAERTVELRLTNVTPLSAHDGYERQPYSLEFTGPLKPLLPQSTYKFQNESMGELDIFIVPIGPRGQAMYYEAIFT